MQNYTWTYRIIFWILLNYTKLGLQSNDLDFPVGWFDNRKSVITTIPILYLFVHFVFVIICKRNETNKFNNATHSVACNNAVAREELIERKSHTLWCVNCGTCFRPIIYTYIHGYVYVYICIHVCIYICTRLERQQRPDALVREIGVSQHGGPNSGFPEILGQSQYYRIEQFKRGLNWASIMPRDARISHSLRKFSRSGMLVRKMARAYPGVTHREIFSKSY